jgi:hypothetical protein
LGWVNLSFKLPLVLGLRGFIMYFSENCVAKTCREQRRVVKSIVVVFAAFLNLAFSSTASAAIIQYRVEGTFDIGNLTGLDYLELFTFDDSSKPNVLDNIPWTTEILTYDLDVESLSKHWTLTDWSMERTFSQWVDSNGFLNSLAYLATPGPPGNPPAVSEFFDDGAPNSRSKTVKWYEWPRWNTRQTNSTDLDPTVTVTTVPEPASTLSLLALTTFGAASTLKRKLNPSKSTKKEIEKVS